MAGQGFAKGTARRRLAHALDLAALRWTDRRLARSHAQGQIPAHVDSAIHAQFAALHDAETTSGSTDGPVREAIVTAFHRTYYDDPGTWRQTYYRGIPVRKCPLDLWLYQEMLAEVRPSLIIEAGTFAGGSAYYLADLCGLLGVGQVVTVDIDEQPNLPQHDRITYLQGSSTDPSIVAEIAAMRQSEGAVLVILDSDHSEAHVRDELAAYAPLVTEGSYLIVEDTNANGHPVLPEHGPGPWEATQDFMRANDEFVIDSSKEKFHLTFNPQGYIKRVRPAPSEPRSTRDG